MKVTDILAQSKTPRFTFELVPPLKGQDVHLLFDNIAPLVDLGPAYVNITSHRDEVVYRQGSDGGYRKVTITKRPGSVALAAAIMRRFNVEVVSHVICSGASRNAIENDLIDLNFLDIDNVMALRGDPVPGEPHFVAEAEGHAFGSELVAQIKAMNHGHYLDKELTDCTPTNFCVGVGGYPEKHHESISEEADLLHLKEKVEAGADYIVTQMFFDNARYFDFVKRCRAIGITVPVIPGLKPVATASHLQMLPATFHIVLPEDLRREVLKCKDNAAVNEVGVEWAVMQTKELIASGCPAVHYYTMGRSENVRRIIHRAF